MGRRHEVKLCPACRAWAPFDASRCACGQELRPASPASRRPFVREWLTTLPFPMLLLGALAGAWYVLVGVPWAGPELNATGRRVLVAVGVVAFLLAGAVLGELFGVIWPGPPMTPPDARFTSERRAALRAFYDAEASHAGQGACFVGSMLLLLAGAVVGAWLLSPPLSPLLLCFTIWAVASPWLLAGLAAFRAQYRRERPWSK